MPVAPPRANLIPLVAPGRIETHPADFTFTASASATLATVDAALVRHNQFFPLEGPADAELGQLVAFDSTGPLRLGFGGWRDLMLGCQFENGRAELLTVGGRVMKNVAGYDLTKFMVGQRGVFGRLVTITARSYLRPEAALAFRLSTETDLSTLSPAPQWLIQTRSAIWAGYLGNAPLINLASERLGQSDKVQMVTHSPDDDLAMRSRLWAYPPGGTDHHRVRISVPPAKLRSFVLEAKLIEWIADPWHGILLATLSTSEATRIREVARRFGGKVEGPGLPVCVTATEAKILHRIKTAIDPNNHLHPLELEVL